MEVRIWGIWASYSILKASFNFWVRLSQLESRSSRCRSQVSAGQTTEYPKALASHSSSRGKLNRYPLREQIDLRAGKSAGGRSWTKGASLTSSRTRYRGPFGFPASSA